MYGIIYSPIVQEKLAALKLKLVEMCGENVGIKHFSQVIDGFEVRLAFSNTGIPIKTIYDVGPEFEHYFVIYSHKNYFLYYIEGDKVYVMEMYDEREDFARTLFGIVTTSKETLEDWGEFSWDISLYGVVDLINKSKY